MVTTPAGTNPTHSAAIGAAYERKQEATRVMNEEPEILTLAIRLSGWRGDGYEWLRTIEIPASASLHDLHHAIQRIVRFDDDHLYTFYVGRHWRQRGTELTDPDALIDEDVYENEEEDEDDELSLGNVFPLGKNKNLYYWFDFGDDWIFEIKSRGKTKVLNRRMKYPRVIEKHGRNPRQYGR